MPKQQNTFWGDLKRENKTIAFESTRTKQSKNKKLTWQTM
jgi:hypothetical protein